MLGEAGKQPELVNLLQQETEGNTFFIVEVVRTLAEEAGQLDQISRRRLPRTVFAGRMQTVIERRLQRVPAEAYPLLKVAAVAGRQIDVKLLRNIDLKINVEAWLDRCAEASVLEVQQGWWRFAHDKLREGVLLKLPADEQKRLHRQVAETIEQVYATDLSPFYPRLAYHWSQVVADEHPDPVLVSKAIDYLQKAGEQAVRSSANQEAVRFFNEAIDLLKTKPDTSSERIQQELTLQVALGNPLIATKGYASPEVEQAYTRARELVQQVGESPQLFPMLYGVWVFHYAGTKLQTARDLAEQFLSLAQRQQDPALLLTAHGIMGNSLLSLGEVASAQEHLEQSIPLYNPQQHRSLAFLYGEDPKMVCLAYLGLSLWALGYPDQALERSHEALALDREVSHPHSLAFAMAWTTLLHLFRRDGQAVQKQAKALIALSEEQGFGLWLMMGTFWQGWGLAEQEQITEGIPQMRQFLPALQGLVHGSYMVALLADVYRKVGQVAEGLTLLTEVLATVHRTGERFYEAEIHRLKGELLWMQGETEAAVERHYQQAIEVARQQKAKSWELRAVISLCRLRQKQGKIEEARQRLAEIYNWFTEGFDTVDLQEAKALLDELS